MMKKIAGLLAALVTTACATPGIDYAARVVPSNTAVVETRTVDVGRFSGPSGNWYADRFEAMIANATLDGQPWFRLARYSAGGPPVGERSGIYEGDINIEDYRAEEYSQTVTKCVEWDGPFDCERRIEVEEICLRENVRVSVTPRLVEYGSGRLLFSDIYYGSSSGESCDEIYRVSRRGHRGSSWGYGGSWGISAPNGLIEDALSDTLRDIRPDIAPVNTTVRATFVADAIDPVVMADARFEDAVKMGRKDPMLSCALWEALSQQYPNSPAVTHNLGACAEASGDMLGAQTLYARAVDQSAAYMVESKSAKAIVSSLSRVSSQRSGAMVLDRLNANRQPVPGS